jgi:hypothetical protein
MDVQCAVCGTTFSARNRKAKYCSDRCRKRKDRGGKVVELPSAPSESEDRRGPVEWATVTELVEAGKLDTVLGQTCLALARRVDRPGLDTGSSLATVAERLRVMLAEATRGTGKASAPQSLQDELAERRKRHGA